MYFVDNEATHYDDVVVDVTMSKIMMTMIMCPWWRYHNIFANCFIHKIKKTQNSVRITYNSNCAKLLIYILPFSPGILYFTIKPPIQINASLVIQDNYTYMYFVLYVF